MAEGDAVAEQNFIIEAAIVLAAAIVGVLLAERLKLGSRPRLPRRRPGHRACRIPRSSPTWRRRGPWRNSASSSCCSWSGSSCRWNAFASCRRRSLGLGGGQILICRRLDRWDRRSPAAPRRRRRRRCARLVLDRHRAAPALRPAQKLNSRFGRAAFGILIMPGPGGRAADRGRAWRSVRAELGGAGARSAFLKAIVAMALILGVGRLACVRSRAAGGARRRSSRR